VLKKYIDESLKSGIITPSVSPAGSPIFFAKKKNGELRPVVDYCKLNVITVKNRYALPLIDTLLGHLQRAKVFSKIDIHSAFNLIRMSQGSQPLTAFRCR
jgi:hypothetical protein